MGMIGSEWDDVFQSILKKCERGERPCSLRNKTTMLQQIPLRAADMTKPSFTYLLAASSGLAANILLGVSSLYWRELNELTPQVLVAYRVLLSLLALAVIIGFGQGFRHLVKLNIRTLGLHCTASFLVAVNWGAFIWASLHGHVLESGFGYLLAPFLSITMGVFFYREKLKPAQTVSMLTIMAAALLLALTSSELNHWIYVLIAVTWGSYTCIKKATPLNAVEGLFVETLFLTLAIVLAVALLGWSLAWPDPMSTQAQWLIPLAGVISVVPLIMFAYAIGRIPLSQAALFQFVLPITQLVIAVYVYKQPISINALLLYSFTVGVLIVLIIYELATQKK